MTTRAKTKAIHRAQREQKRKRKTMPLQEPMGVRERSGLGRPKTMKVRGGRR